MGNESGEWIMHGMKWDNPECIQSVDKAIEYINKVGFLPLFKNDIKGFSLEERTVPEYWWSDNLEIDPWMWRAIIARQHDIVYGKFFDKKAGFISKKWLPVFANYRRDVYDFDALYDGKAPNKHKKIMVNFIEDNADSEIYSNELKKQAGFGKDGEKGFDGAITNLMMQTYLCNCDFKKRVNKKGMEYRNLDYYSENDVWADFQKDPIKYINTIEQIVPGLLGNDDSVYGLPEDLAREVQDECFFPDGLLCSLRRYQEWGVKYILHQGRVLLGDEMGLGKTIQAIAAMVSLRNTGATHFVVLCPASVIINWCREIGKFSKLRAIKVHGSSRLSALDEWIRMGGVAVTTYETTAYFKLPDDFKFSMLVVDEAHYIKNPDANRSINTRAICAHAQRLLFMTGTALENNVDEMVNLIDILRPDIAKQISRMKMLSSAPQFREKVATVYYRRKREDVLTELPELLENEEWCQLCAEEEQAYEEAVLSRNYNAARRVSWNVSDLKNSCKANRMLEIIEEAKSEDRKIIVFSFYLDTIKKISDLLGEQCMEPINGSISPSKRQEIIDKFDKAPAGQVLAAQIIAGGTGLNIQSASVVILCEPQLKPSIENQAISRAYRMGQARNVIVYRLLCDNTIDEKITDLLSEKQAVFDAFADKSVAAENVEIDTTSLSDIIQEEIDRIKNKAENIVDDKEITLK